MTEELGFAVAAATALRKAGVRTQLYGEKKKFKAKMGYADKLAVPFAVLIGEDEMKEGVLSVKDMATGEQVKLSPDEAAAFIARRVAAKNAGVDELVSHALHIAKYQERPLRQDFCDQTQHGGAVHRCLHGISHLIEDHAKAAGLPTRFAASKLIEGDRLIEQQLKLDQNESEMVEHIILQMEKERGLDRAAAIAEMRFDFIARVCRVSVQKPRQSRERQRSERLDRILTGKYTAIPAFIAIMGLVFYLTFHVIGLFLQDLLTMGIDALAGITDRALTAAGVSPALHSLVIQGLFEGVGSVLSFLPIIVTLFFFLSLLEDSGYIARVAFVMDKLLRKLGLSVGKLRSQSIQLSFAILQLSFRISQFPCSIIQSLSCIF